jgi:hypothetical protein
MKKRVVFALAAVLVVGACAHFGGQIVRGRPYAGTGGHYTQVAVIASNSTTGDFVVVKVPGNKFEVWWDEFGDGVLDQQNPGCTTCFWPTSVGPASIATDIQNNRLFVSAWSSGSAYPVFRRQFNSSGVPTSGWTQVCSNLGGGTVIAVRGSKIYALRPGTNPRLEIFDASTCAPGNQHTITLPPGRTIGDRNMIASERSTNVIVTAIELTAGAGSDIFVVRWELDSMGNVSTNDQAMNRIIMANDEFVSFDANRDFITVVSQNGTNSFNIPLFDVDLYYRSSYSSFVDSFTVTGLSRLSNMTATGALTFTGAPCPSGKTGMFMWIGRDPHIAMDGDNRLLERRPICAD